MDTLDVNELLDQMLKLAPSKYDRNMDFRKHVEALLKKYLVLLKRFESKDIDGFDDLYLKIEKHCQTIVETLRFYYEGKYASAYSKLATQLESLPLWEAHHKLPCYRMRVMEDGSIPTFEGMFHIPFRNRGIVATQRYSAPGMPCLYLGLSPYTCWKEMGCPDTRKVFVSKFQPNSFFAYLNFSLPTKEFINDGEQLSIKAIKTALEYFPFVIASMVKVRDDKKTFKPEYIIPQLALQYILENRKFDDNPEKTNIGIMYTSIHYDGKYPISYYLNIAIPAYFSGEEKFSSLLCKWFSFSEPIRCCPEEVATSIDIDEQYSFKMVSELKEVPMSNL